MNQLDDLPSDARDDILQKHEEHCRDCPGTRTCKTLALMIYAFWTGCAHGADTRGR